jgi:hypothetical protein
MAAHHTQQRDVSLIEMQQRIMAVKTTDELADLSGGRNDHRRHR